MQRLLLGPDEIPGAIAELQRKGEWIVNFMVELESFTVLLAGVMVVVAVVGS